MCGFLCVRGEERELNLPLPEVQPPEKREYNNDRQKAV